MSNPSYRVRSGFGCVLSSRTSPSRGRRDRCRRRNAPICWACSNVTVVPPRGGHHAGGESFRVYAQAPAASTIVCRYAADPSAFRCTSSGDSIIAAEGAQGTKVAFGCLAASSRSIPLNAGAYWSSPFHGVASFTPINATHAFGTDASHERRAARDAVMLAPFAASFDPRAITRTSICEGLGTSGHHVETVTGIVVPGTPVTYDLYPPSTSWSASTRCASPSAWKTRESPITATAGP